jgi:DnaK suppressor protein
MAKNTTKSRKKHQKSGKGEVHGKKEARARTGAAHKSVTKPAARKAKPVTKKPAAAKKKPAAKKPAAEKIAKKKVGARKVVAKKATAKAIKKVVPVKKARPVKKAKPDKKTGKLAVVEQVAQKKTNTGTAVKGISARATVPQPIDNEATMQNGRYALPSAVYIDLPAGYKPTPREEYMNPRQLQYFRARLLRWREELVEESRQTIESLRDEVRDVGDEAERATRETENSLELRTRDRYRKLIAKIDNALKRIEEGRYGFCEETDEEIGLDRLDARPIATLSLDAQERREHLKKQMGD